MPLQICRVFHIFVVYFQVGLSIVVNSLVGNHFYGTRHYRVILDAPCPRGFNLVKTYLHGSTASVLKGSSPQYFLPSSCYTNRPPLKLSLSRLKSLVIPKISHSCIPSHWTFFITFACGMRFFYIAKN